MKKKTGRPPKITLEVVESVGKLIALGMTEEQACLAEDVKHESFCTARKRNGEFERAIKREQAFFLSRALRAISTGGEFEVDGNGKILGRKPWQGLAWILERRHKPQFNRTDGAAVLAVNAGTLTLSPEQEAELQKMAKEMFSAK